MKILHIADLHLGRQFNDISLDEDHAVILEQILSALVTQRADMLVIAGDIFDRAAPPASAIRQFNGFLARVMAETAAVVVIIAGNHDSADRIETMAVMTDRTRAHVRGVLSAEEPPLILDTDAGQIAVSALPFAYEYAARACFDDETISTPEDILRAQITAARAHVPPGAHWVVVAHAFVQGATGSDSERPLARVGGIETVPATVFDGASYVALGHLHRPQNVGAPNIRYAGSPLAFGFDEAGTEKSMTLIEIGAAGVAAIETIPFAPLRQVRVLRGRFADLIEMPQSDDLIQLVLTDQIRQIDGIRRAQAVFPNACSLIYEMDQRAPEAKSVTAAGARRLPAALTPLEMLGGFLVTVRETPLSEAEAALVGTALDDLRRKEGEA